MHILCPHCGNPIEVLKLSAHEEIACPSCGSSFRLETGSTTSDTMRAGHRVGRFEVIETVGHGAFGTVYEARDPGLARTVAVKVPRAGNVAGPQELDRFLREARSAAQLRHPSIISVHEVGQADGLPYIVSDFVRGVTLADLLSARRPSFRGSAELVAAVAEALHYAHERGVVHRDVKPSNIMIGDDGRPLLMDFGLAKRDAGEITMTMEGQLLGTPAYMSPEQARGEGHAVDGRGDVYSLGVVLYQLLTGELPFRGTQRMLLMQVLQDEPRPPRRLNDKIPRDLETICLEAMAKEPRRRYQTAREMADDLRRFLEGKPILARRIGALERAGRWCRRNPVVASLLAAVLLVFAAGAGVSTYYGVEAGSRADQAQKSESRAATALGDLKKEKEELEKKKKELEQKSAEAEDLLYDHQLSEAGQALATHDNELLLARLADARHQPSGKDHRGWEWYCLDRVARPFVHEFRFDVQRGAVTLRGRSSPWDSIFANLSPDGTRVVAAPRLPPARSSPGGVYDCATGRLLAEIPLAEPRAKIAGVSVSGDGRFVAWVESKDELVSRSRLQPMPEGEYRIRIVDRETGRQEAALGPFPVVPLVRVGVGGEQLAALLDPDMRAKADAGRAGRYPRLVVWRRGQERPAEVQIRTGPGDLAFAPVLLDPDAALGVVVHTPAASSRPFAQRDTVVEVWSLTDPPKRRGEPITNAAGVMPLAFSADGAYFAVLHLPKSVVVYETAHLKQAGRCELPEDAPESMTAGRTGAVSSDGRRVALAGNAQIWVGERLDAPSAGQPGADVGRWRTASLLTPGKRSLGGLPPLPGSPVVAWNSNGELVIGFCDEKHQPQRDSVVWTVPLAAALGYAASWPDSLTADGVDFRPCPAFGPRIVYVPLKMVSSLPADKPRDWPVLVWDVAAAKVVRRLTVKGYLLTGAQITDDGRRLLVSVQASPSTPATPQLSGFALPLPPAGGKSQPAAPAAPAPPVLPRARAAPQPPTREVARCRVSLHDLDDPSARQLAGAVLRGSWLLADGGCLVEAGADNEHKIRSLETGAIHSELKLPADRRRAGLAFARDGRRMLVATWPEPTDPGPDRAAVPLLATLRCLAPDSGKELWAAHLPEALGVHVFRSDPQPARMHVEEPQMAFAPDGRRVVVFVRVDGGAIRGWVLDAATGEMVRAVRDVGAPVERVRSSDLPPRLGKIRFGPGDRLALTFGKDILVWDGQGAGPLWRLPQPASWRAPSCVFTADGRRLLTLDPASLGGRRSATLRVWDLATGRQLVQVPTAKVASPMPLAGDPSGAQLRLDGDRLLVPVADGVQVFDGSSRKE